MELGKMENTRKVLKEYAEKMRELYFTKLMNDDKWATGKLETTLKPYSNISFKTGHFEVGLDLLEYWKYIEQGRRAYPNDPRHWPPIKAIRDWVTVKKSLPNGNINPNLPADQQLNAKAYMYRASIGKKGITPKPFMAQTTDEVFEDFCDAVRYAIQTDLQLIIDEQLTVFIEPLV